MPSEARQKKTTEQLKEGLKSSILGPQNLGSGGARAPRAPLDLLVTGPLWWRFPSAIVALYSLSYALLNFEQ